jgi:peptide/nickel transport system permease protein
VQRFLVRRFILMLFVLVAVTLVVFAMSRIQGDPRYLYLGAESSFISDELWDEWGRELGLDKPVPLQYLIWLGKAVRGDLGKSIREARPVRTVVAERIIPTFQLGLGAWIFAFLIGWPLGVLSAVKRGTVWDYAGRTFALFGQALPPFWVGIMMILIFSVQLEWLPTSRRGGIEHYIMPSITLGWLAAAGQLRLLRSAMLNVLDSEFIKFARAKGVNSTRVIWKHALRNALISPLTVSALTLAGFITGTVVTESVFAWPGLGRLAVDAVINNDFPVLVGAVLFFTLIYVGVIFIIDLTYAYIDPRIRFD